MAADASSFDLERILRTLERNGVEYVLVGGLGARAHGATRSIEDVDVPPRSSGETSTVTLQRSENWEADSGSVACLTTRPASSR